jgi:hypothetical protein
VRCLLESERGEAIEQLDDQRDVLHERLPPITDEDSQCLRFIDWYGETVFNRLQMDRFLLEWGVIQERADGATEREIMGQIERMARRCRDEVHLYLRFSGD